MIQNFLNQFLLLFFLVFAIAWAVTPFWIRQAKKASLTGKDIHKTEEIQVAEMGGIVVLLAFLIGVMGYVAIRIFLFETSSFITPILAILTAILIAGIIGITDDILGWKIGLRQWQKPLLTLLVAAPIMAVNAGTRIMHIPFIGEVNLSIIYPLIIIPCFILVGANGFNMLAGFNGLEAGQGMIILSTLAYLSYQTGSPWLTIISILMIAALLGFWVYNRYPAKIFPGDTLTYTVGALTAIIAIFANIEKAFIILFIPYILEFFLKLRGKFQKESFAQVKEDGTLVPRYEKIYGLENLSVLIMNKLKIKATEKRVVIALYGLQIACVILALRI